MGRGGSSTNNNDSNDDFFSNMITLGALIGTIGISILCSWKGAFVGKQKTNGKNPSESHEPVEKSPKDAIPCINISKRFATCLESNGYDINKCIIYYDLLKDCQKN